MTSNLNIFSVALSTARMVAVTQAGGEECGAPGDYVSWEEEDWQLHSQARREMVGELEGPCRRESQVTVYTAEFDYHSGCMEHCQKIGQGRSPPVRTLEEYDWLWRELTAITPELWRLNYLWLAATDEEKENVFRDYYSPHDKLETGVSWPWYHPTAENRVGDNYNCLAMFTDEPAEKTWIEWECFSYHKSCPCQSKQPPNLLLRGLCKNSALSPKGNTKYTPKQLPVDPTDVFLVGQVSTQIRYNDSSEMWVMTDAVSSVRAQSRASKVSYLLGKHKWTVTGDVFACNEGQPYTTLLKLSGCNDETLKGEVEGKFTCDDGQCIPMQQRCNQIPNCRDESDEVNCKLVILKENYNKKVPPIIPMGMNYFKQTEVGISISLLKIVSMEEVQPKIDIQFEITLNWRENRAIYHNLKDETSLNALTDYEIYQIWLPYVIYANTDMKEAVRLEDGLDTTIVVTREGNFTRNGNGEVDEIEIFEGKENKLLMYQTYTKSFQCLYKLAKYPFDTQVDRSYELNMVTLL